MIWLKHKPWLFRVIVSDCVVLSYVAVRNGEEWDGALLLRSPYTLKTG